MASSKPVSSFDNFHPVPSLQELMKKPLGSVPQRYICSDKEDPSLLESSPPFPTVPTIDLNLLASLETSDLELEKLHSACKEWGIFQLLNHGVQSSLIEELKHGIEEFYKLPLEEKMNYKVRPGEFEGYGTVVSLSNGKYEWGDRFYMITNPLHRRRPHLFPELPSSLRNVLDDYLLELQELAMKLLAFMATALEMDVKEMEEMFDDGMQSMRMTYYPPCPQPELVVGISPHSDGTGITILNQINGVDGLQIKKDGVWIPISFLPDALVVNVGDILEILSNGVYNSVEHRATVNSGKERISVAFFVNPKFEAEVGPATSLIRPQNPPLFKKIVMEDYAKGYFTSTHRLNGKIYLEHMKLKTGEAPTPPS